MLLRDAGVVLGRLDYSETSQILVLFTREHGKVRAIAKGAKRSTKTRFAPAIDLLDIGTAVFSVRHERAEGLATLTEWKQTQTLAGLRHSLQRINAAQYMGEITIRLMEDWDPHPELFDALIATLHAVCDSESVVALIAQFQLAILDQVGSLPRFDECVSCGSDSHLTHFSSFEGGLLCRDCEPGKMEKWEIAPVTIKALRDSQNHDSPHAHDTPAHQAAFSLLNYHVSHLIGMEPRMSDSIVPLKQRRRV